MSRLPLALELEAERLGHLKIDDEEFARELKVVMEERRMRTDDNPNALAWEKFQAVARPGTGYAHRLLAGAPCCPSCSRNRRAVGTSGSMCRATPPW